MANMNDEVLGTQHLRPLEIGDNRVNGPPVEFGFSGRNIGKVRKVEKDRKKVGGFD
jgi:hypothetical protein